LRILPAQTPVALRSKPIETLSRARILERRTLTPRTGATGNFTGEVSVEAGKAAAVDLAGGKSIRGAVAVAGQQIVRAIFLSAHEEPLADLYVAGAASLAAPVAARRAVFIGEGLEAPVTVPAKAKRSAKTARSRAAAAPPSTARERVGLEHDSVLLALSRRVFAGHGCVFEAIARPGFAAQPLDSVPGHELLRNVTRFRLHFPAAPKAWSLVLTVEPLVAQPGSALEEIRWRSAQAKFANLRTVIAPDRVALIMDVLAPQPWKLDVDFGRKWRCAGAVLREGAARTVALEFGARSSWDQLDDRFVPAARTSSKVTVQIFQ
jgi:hypothetical protein